MNIRVGAQTANDNCTGRCIPIESKVSLLNDKQKNKSSIVCRRCDSLIFPPNVVPMVSVARPLKIMSEHGTGPNEVEEVTYFWRTENDLVFDTVGWQTVDGIRVLMCGDCEFGPIGLRETINDEKQVFLVAVERVKYT